MNRGLELEGQRFGHLTVLKRLDERENRYIMWLCRCDCGNEIKVNTRRLVRGTVDNCGCILEKTARPYRSEIRETCGSKKDSEPERKNQMGMPL